MTKPKTKRNDAHLFAIGDRIVTTDGQAGEVTGTSSTVHVKLDSDGTVIDVDPNNIAAAN